MSKEKLKRYGLSGYNKPKRTPSHPTKSHVVLAKEGDKVKLIRFGMQGAKNKPPTKGESAADKAKRKSFKARHAKNIAKVKCQQLFGQTGQSGASIVNNCKFFIYGRRSN